MTEERKSRTERERWMEKNQEKIEKRRVGWKMDEYREEKTKLMK